MDVYPEELLEWHHRESVPLSYNGLVNGARLLRRFLNKSKLADNIFPGGHFHLPPTYAHSVFRPTASFFRIVSSTLT